MQIAARATRATDTDTNTTAAPETAGASGVGLASCSGGKELQRTYNICKLYMYVCIYIIIISSDSFERLYWQFIY